MIPEGKNGHRWDTFIQKIVGFIGSVSSGLSIENRGNPAGARILGAKSSKTIKDAETNRRDLPGATYLSA